MLPVLESGEETLIGGQAVIEGVMMRSPHAYSVAVRRPDGAIVVEENPLPRVSERYPIFRLPVLRGLGTLGQAMWLGLRAMRFSASQAMVEEDSKASSSSVSSGTMYASIAFSLVSFLFLFKFVPLALATWVGRVYEPLHSRLAVNLVDGLIRIALFLGYLYLLSRFKDIARVFEYHGAEHKVVFNFESGQPLTVENAQRFQTWHPRCGTSFLLVVMVVAMIFYAFLPIDNFVLKLVARIAMLPLVTGVSYEMIRFAAKRRGGLMAALTTPGLWLQRITTKPPADAQAEVAIHALQRAMALEQVHGGELVVA
jgi:uncharacterized protein YqhQ